MNRAVLVLGPCLVLFAAACVNRAPDVVVYLSTDLRSARGDVEVDWFTTTLERDGELVAPPVDTSASLLDLRLLHTARVALFDHVEPGDYIVRTTAWLGDPDDGGTRVVERAAAITVRGDVGVLMFLSRQCLGVTCAGEETCAIGACVARACLGLDRCTGTPPACLTDASCVAPSACAVARCVAGTCVTTPNDAVCAPDEECDLADGCVRCESVVSGFRDNDEDGLGGAAIEACPGPNIVTMGGDCDDTDPAVTVCDAGIPDDARLDDAGPTDAGDAGGADAATDCVPAACDDDDPCTRDFCASITGPCQHEPQAGTCDDGDPCTEGDACADGACAGTPLNCDDGVGCTDDACGATGCTHEPNVRTCRSGAFARCDPVAGCQYGTGCDGTTCVADPMACEAAMCMDSTCRRTSTCTSGQSCCDGACMNCDDGNPCTDDACSGTTCGHTAVVGRSCNDADACTGGDACTASGACAGTPITCPSDGNPCTDDVCSSGTCGPVPHVGSCDDQNPCTGGDACSGTTCTGSPLTGGCDDGDPCTMGETCSGGACTSGTPISCDDGNACTIDSCAGGCLHQARDDGSICGAMPGDMCRFRACSAGACTGEVYACAIDEICCTRRRPYYCSLPGAGDCI